MKTETRTLSLGVNIASSGEVWDLQLFNSVLHAAKINRDSKLVTGGNTAPGAILTGTMPEIMARFEGRMSVDKTSREGMLAGDEKTLSDLLGMLDSFAPNFPLVLPQRSNHQ